MATETIVRVTDAIITLNQAIANLNDGDINSEDYYWWRAVLEIFDLSIDDYGNIIDGKGELNGSD